MCLYECKSIYVQVCTSICVCLKAQKRVPGVLLHHPLPIPLNQGFFLNLRNISAELETRKLQQHFCFYPSELGL